MTVALLLLAGCGGPNAANNPAASKATYAVFTGSVELMGEIAVKGTFTDTLTSRQETCQEYVRGLAPATTLWVVPTPNLGSSVTGHIVSLTAGVPSEKPSSGYHGPGTYAEPSATVSVVIVDNASFLPGRQAHATITVSSDGSGSLTFSGMVDTFNSAVESGREQWTCSG